MGPVSRDACFPMSLASPTTDMVSPAFPKDTGRRAVTATGAFVLAVAAFLFYGGYATAGYNFADDGHYAQVAYEFLLGTDPHAIRFGYGLLWHKLGEWLFLFTGPSHTAVRALFFAVLGGTAVLLWTTLRQLGVSAFLAGMAAALALVVPAYPATAFYGFCTLLNVAAQLPLARRGKTATAADTLLPALALSVTFQIRADFGYVFAVPLALLILDASVAGPSGTRMGCFARLAGTALAMAAAGHAPLILLAIKGAYLDLVVAEYLRYPKAVALIILRLLHLEPAAAGGAGTLLQRVSPRALWLGPPDQAGLALLIYGCPAVIAAFAAFEAIALVRTPRGARGPRARVDGVILIGALASFPHYFLYRPDLPHLANFMPGFLVVAPLFASRWWGAATAGRWRGAALPGGFAILTLPLVYLWMGLSGPGTGSPVLAQGRTVPFDGPNGVHVRLTADEHALLTALRDVILANSRPGDRIVCLPFCPGLAFLTERRMLLREHYVDDSLLVTDPGWIERSIALTDAERPPVVVTFDWPLNGTELSRVRNWAAPYYTWLDGVAREKRDVLGATVHLLPPR